jgi:hypothetical protein
MAQMGPTGAFLGRLLDTCQLACEDPYHTRPVAFVALVVGACQFVEQLLLVASLLLRIVLHCLGRHSISLSF